MSDEPLSFDLARVYGARDLDELRAEYDRIATVYDADDWDWLGPEIVAAVTLRFVPPNAHVLDAGAGTGQLGVALSDAGFTRIDALDLSEGMLAEARQKGVYVDLRLGRLGDRLSYEDAAFDAVVASGVFTTGHAPPTGLSELARITRPGGVVIFSLRSDELPPGFAEAMTQLVEAGVWRLAERGDEVALMPRTAPSVVTRVWVYEVC